MGSRRLGEWVLICTVYTNVQWRIIGYTGRSLGIEQSKVNIEEAKSEQNHSKIRAGYGYNVRLGNTVRDLSERICRR